MTGYEMATLVSHAEFLSFIHRAEDNAKAFELIDVTLLNARGLDTLEAYSILARIARRSKDDEDSFLRNYRNWKCASFDEEDGAHREVLRLMSRFLRYC